MTRYCTPAALALVSLGACSPNYSPDTYASSAVQQASKVEQGVIVGARAVAVQVSGATGAVAGAAAGGIVASQAPGNGVSNALTTLGGSLVGGMVGAGIERATGDTTATEYIVRKANGELVSVTQKDAAPLALGTKVLVIAGSQARIVADYTVPVEPIKAADVAKPGEKATEASEAPVPVKSEALLPAVVPVLAPAAAPTAVVPAVP